MRILFLSTWFPSPPDNGSKLRAYHLLRALAQKHDVMLISFAFDTANDERPGDRVEHCSDIRVLPVNPFMANRSRSLHTFLSPRPVASRPIPAMTRLVKEIVQTDSLDAAVASTDMMSAYCLLAPPDTATILEEHNSGVRWMMERYRAGQGRVQRLRYWISWQKQRQYEARRFRRFDLVTMVSPADADATNLAIQDAPTRVEIVPNGVDCHHNRPGYLQANPAMLVYNGALTYSANYDAMQWFLAEIYPRIKVGFPDTSLTITGSTMGVDLPGLALDESVQLPGFVEDIRTYVGGATACVVPLREGGGTRLKILEAMALGTPVVSTTKGAEGLDVVDGEHLLLADEPGHFSQQTIELMRNSQLRQQLTENARRLVEQQYDWEQIGRTFVSLVEDVVWVKKERSRTSD